MGYTICQTAMVDILKLFILQLMFDGEILYSGHYIELIDSSPEFMDLVKTYTLADVSSFKRQRYSTSEIQRANAQNEIQALKGDKMIKKKKEKLETLV